MPAGEVRIGDIGTRITLTFYDGTNVVDISGASTKQIITSDPDGSSTANAATFTTDGTDGKIYYDSIAATFDQAGTWQIQGKVVTATGTWSSDITDLKVYANL